MNEKQVKLNEFMLAFEKKSPLILISATAVKVTFMKKHPRHRCLVFSNWHLRWVCIMLHVWSISYRISMTSSLLYQLYQAILFKYAYPYTVTGMESELFLPEASFGLRVLSLPASVCVCLSVCLCVNHEFVRAITLHPFKLESPNLEHRCKTPWLRSL